MCSRYLFFNSKFVNFTPCAVLQTWNGARKKPLSTITTCRAQETVALNTRYIHALSPVLTAN